MSSENLGAVCGGLHLLRIIPEQQAGLARLISDTRMIVEGSVTSNIREKREEVMWHKCGLYAKVFLLDGDEIHKHCSSHRIMMETEQSVVWGYKGFILE